MADVMTKCPYTGKDIRAGFHAADDQQAFEHAPFERTIVHCPAADVGGTAPSLREIESRMVAPREQLTRR